MANFYEEKVKLSTESVTVCVPHDKYKEFLRSLNQYNKDRQKRGFPIAEIESLRSNVKRLTKGSISYSDFRSVYF